MEYNNIIILVLFIVVIYLLCSANNTKSNNENFTSKYVANENIYLGHRRDGYDLLDDSLFKNVITYNNDDDPYECGSKLGIEKCLESCSGRCIEFGVTGIGYCFPKE